MTKGKQSSRATAKKAAERKTAGKGPGAQKPGGKGDAFGKRNAASDGVPAAASSSPPRGRRRTVGSAAPRRPVASAVDASSQLPLMASRSTPPVATDVMLDVLPRTAPRSPTPSGASSGAHHVLPPTAPRLPTSQLASDGAPASLGSPLMAVPPSTPTGVTPGSLPLAPSSLGSPHGRRPIPSTPTGVTPGSVPPALAGSSTLSAGFRAALARLPPPPVGPLAGINAGLALSGGTSLSMQEAGAGGPPALPSVVAAMPLPPRGISSALPPLPPSAVNVQLPVPAPAASSQGRADAGEAQAPITLEARLNDFSKRFDRLDAALAVVSSDARYNKEAASQVLRKLEALCACVDGLVRSHVTGMDKLMTLITAQPSMSVAAGATGVAGPSGGSEGARSDGHMTRSGNAIPEAPWGAKLQDKITVQYVNLWVMAKTPDDVFLSNSALTAVMVEVCQKSFKVDRASADRITLSRFRFPNRVNNAVDKTEDLFTSYMRRSIAQWHIKSKDFFFDAFLQRLVLDGQYGGTAVKLGKRTPYVTPTEAVRLLSDDTFYIRPICHSAFVGAMFAFIAALPGGSKLIVPLSAANEEAYLDLMTAQFGWFILKLRMALTSAAGLPQLVTRGSNADEGMRKLWAMDSAQARRFLKNRGKELMHRLRIKDGDDDQCVSVGYDDQTIEDLRKRILIKSKKTPSAGESPAVPPAPPGAEGTAASALGGHTAESSAAGDAQGATPASEPPPATVGGAAVEPQTLKDLNLFDLSLAL